MSPLKRIQQMQLIAMVLFAVLPLVFVIALILLRWPEYWKWIASEDTPMTSIEVCVMYTISLISLMLSGKYYVEANHKLAPRWLLMAAGFFWFALDDRFAIHERIRDNLLAPHNITIPFIPIGPGDFLILLYLVIGVCCLSYFKVIWPTSRQAKSLFMAGLLTAIVAVLLDAYDIHQLDIVWQRLEQTIEECLELISQILFLQSVLSIVFDELKKHHQSQ